MTEDPIMFTSSEREPSMEALVRNQRKIIGNVMMEMLPSCFKLPGKRWLCARSERGTDRNSPRCLRRLSELRIERSF